ncbi:MAG: PepSY domain-containing protein [Chthoniobacterales bacterium]|nr:PepSY domain-containing protein [Chthoniobacterales bacterium]
MRRSSWPRRKFSRRQAEAIALRASHGGKIKDGEIEREKGHLVWSFDIAKPKISAITEVLVDARTGKVISAQEENSAQQAAEAKADAQPKR